jgi:hypothetical protein
VSIGVVDRVVTGLVWQVRLAGDSIHPLGQSFAILSRL